MRSAVDVSKAAFVGGICLCVPSFTASVDKHGVRTPGILDHLAQTFGPGSFDAGKEESRFQHMLDSGCALGKRLHDLFMEMKREVHDDEQWEDLPKTSPFRHGPQGAGVVEGRVHPKPQHEFTEWRENERARARLYALEMKTSTTGVHLNRQEAAYLSVNESSAVFVGVPALPNAIIDNITYRECWSDYLGGESPVCAPWSEHEFVHCNGKKTAKVGKYGDSVTCATLKGDTWRQRHDSFKWACGDQAAWCRFALHTEPMHKFLPFIKQRESFMKKKVRKRQGLVPDFLDVKNQRFMDVKTCTFGKRYAPARFRHAQRCDTVKKRQDEVHTKAFQKARDVDIEYNGWDPASGNPGPCQQRLQGFGRIKGFVVGAHGEFSPDLIDFVHMLAKQGSKTRFRDMGFDSPLAAYSTVKHQVLLALGIEAVKGAARLKIDKLGIALAGHESNSAGATRRAASKAAHNAQTDAYQSRHCFYDI